MSNLFIDLQSFANHSADPMYRTTHSMILHYSDKYKDYRKNAKGTRELMKKMKTENLTKLYNNRQKWDTLHHRIPIEYLDALGITESMIATTMEIDQEAYDEAMAEPAYYDGFSQGFSVVSKVYPFDEPLYEQDAIKEVIDTITHEDFKIFTQRYKIILHRPPYYDIWFNVNGKYSYSYHRPAYRIRGQYYEFRGHYTIGWRI